MAYNEATGDVSAYPILHVHVHVDEEILALTIDGEALITTPDHPFFTDDDEWVEAGDLKIGDRIRRADDSVGVVESVQPIDQPQVMFNLTVGESHIPCEN